MSRISPSRQSSLAALAGALSLLASTAASAAQPAIEQFYARNTISLIIGFPPGGGNDVSARMVARYLPNHLPGKPHVVTRNMPGAGSLSAANHIYAIAPNDGTVIGLVAPTLPLLAKLGNPGVRFDPAGFQYIARLRLAVNPLMVWHTQPYTSWKDALTHEITLSATGVGSTASVYPTVLNQVMKTKFKMVMGYKGSGEAQLAMERGETAGHSSGWLSIASQHPDWISERKVRILLQFALTRSSTMKDVPTAYEIAETDEQRAVLRAVLSATELGTMFLTTPAVPPERVEALRRAFDQMMASTEFVSESEKVGLELDPLSGEALQQFVGELASMAPDVIDKVKVAYGEN